MKNNLDNECVGRTLIQHANNCSFYPKSSCFVWRRGTMYFRGLNIDLKRLIREGWIHNDSLSKQVITKSLCAGFLVVIGSEIVGDLRGLILRSGVIVGEPAA
jgi:hypothetical protein